MSSYPDSYSQGRRGKVGAETGSFTTSSYSESPSFVRSPMRADSMTFSQDVLRDARSGLFGTSSYIPPVTSSSAFGHNSSTALMSPVYDSPGHHNFPGQASLSKPPSRTGSIWSDSSEAFPGPRLSIGSFHTGYTTTAIGRGQTEYETRRRASPESYHLEDDSPSSWYGPDVPQDSIANKTQMKGSQLHGRTHSQRRPSNRDEFDGPHQLLDRPSPGTIAAQEKELPHLSTNLFVNEQDNILAQVNDRLSKCAFDFVAKYQFPIPIEADKRPVRIPADREWTEWVYLLKRLATKRRIPARILYNGQIKQLVTVLENSLEMRHAAKHQSRPLKDDRNVLQLISAGLQVAKILKDASAMEFLDHLYVQTERMIQTRKMNPGFLS